MGEILLKVYLNTNNKHKLKNLGFTEMIDWNTSEVKGYKCISDGTVYSFEGEDLELKMKTFDDDSSFDLAEILIVEELLITKVVEQ